MTPQNVLPKVAETIAADYVPATPDHNKFWTKSSILEN